MISVRPNNLSLKYQKFTPAGCKDVGIKKLKLHLQFFYNIIGQR